FQAEDGIRDFHVTGVQTCALPIFLSSCANTFQNFGNSKVEIDESFETVDYDSIITISDMTSIGFEWKRVDDERVVGYNFYRANRSEERRVGKECRYRR